MYDAFSGFVMEPGDVAVLEGISATEAITSESSSTKRSTAQLL